MRSLPATPTPGLRGEDSHVRQRQNHHPSAPYPITITQPLPFLENGNAISAKHARTVDEDEAPSKTPGDRQDRHRKRRSMPRSSSDASSDASPPSPIRNLDAPSAHNGSHRVLVHWNETRSTGALPAPLAHQRPPSPTRLQSRKPYTQNSSDSPYSAPFGTSAARQNGAGLQSQPRFLPPHQLDALERGSSYSAGPPVLNAAFLPSDFLRTSGLLPIRQQQSPSTSRIPVLRSEVLDQRQSIKKCRRDLRQLRVQLRAIQDRKTDTESMYHLALKRFPIQAVAKNRVFKLLQELEELKNSSHSLQSIHDTLERDLEQREFNLEICERRLYHELGLFSMHGSHISANGMSGEHSGHTLDEQVREGETEHSSAVAVTQKRLYQSRISREDQAFGLSIGEAVRETSGNQDIDATPLYRRLVNAVTTLHMAEEEHRELVEEREDVVSTLYNHYLIAASRDSTKQLDEAKVNEVRETLLDVCLSAKFKVQFGPYLVESDLRFLEDFGRVEKKVLAAIQKHSKLVARLRYECIRTGAIPRHLPARERRVVLGEEDDPHDILMDTTPEFSIPMGQSYLPNPLTLAGFPILRQNYWYLLSRDLMTAKGALTQMLRLPKNLPHRAARIEDLVKVYGIETMLTRTAAENKADFTNRWLLQQLRMSSVNELMLYTTALKYLGIKDRDIWQRDVILLWTQDGTNKPENMLHGSEIMIRTQTELRNGGDTGEVVSKE